MRRKKDKSNGITALYERLSRDDDNAGESNSIVHQKQMLEDYAMKHGFTNLVHFTDDGWSGGATVASAIQQDDLLPPIGFSIFFIVSLIGSLNMIMWKLEVNGDEITWRSTFGRKRTFHFEDITYCERKKGSMRVYVNGEKLFTIDSNIDKEEFMEDIKRRRIPVKSYWANQHKKNRK